MEQTPIAKEPFEIYQVVDSTAITLASDTLIYNALPVLSDSFKIIFSFKPDSSQTVEWGQVIQFRTGDGSSYAYGDSIPDIYYHESTETLRFYFDIDGTAQGVPMDSTSGNVESVTVGTDEWHDIVIDQRIDGSTYDLTIWINGINTHSYTNSDARTFSNVKVYASGSATNQTSGEVKDVGVSSIRK